MNDRDKDERISRNIRLTGVFLQAIFEDPSILANIPEGANVFLVPADDPALAAANVNGAHRARGAGQTVYVHHMPAANGTTPIATYDPSSTDRK